MHEGGCLCGAIRFVAGADPVDTGYCHCVLCRKSTGAPVLAWASVPVQSFDYRIGRPAIYRSSAWGQREFCGTCGTQICYRQSSGATTVDINVGCLDEPSALPPRCHIFTKDQLGWMEFGDELPRFRAARPD